MSRYYRPELSKAKKNYPIVVFEIGSPGFNGFFKLYRDKHGRNPYYNSKGLSVPSSWKIPESWTFSEETGYWYTPDEMHNAGYSLIEDEWIHPNDIRRREIEKQTAEFEAKVAARKSFEGHLRQVNATGRKDTILTSPAGVSGEADIYKKKLQNLKEVTR